jgi:hypothetical protein
MLAATVSGGVPLTRYPEAPPTSASTTSPSLEETVSINTAVAGEAAAILRVASTPEILGSCRSMSTTCGASDSTSSNAFSPSAASPTTSKPRSMSRVLRPVRKPS